MSFEEKFPSLKDKICTTNINSLPGITILNLQKHCIDKAILKEELNNLESKILGVWCNKNLIKTFEQFKKKWMLE